MNEKTVDGIAYTLLTVCVSFLIWLLLVGAAKQGAADALIDYDNKHQQAVQQCTPVQLEVIRL